MSLYTYKATVVRWIDGDTVDLELDLGFKMKTVQRFRLLGVDAPERGQPGYRTATLIAETVAPIGSKLVIASIKTDKYGRWLVDLPAVRVALIEAKVGHPVPESWR